MVYESSSHTKLRRDLAYRYLDYALRSNAWLYTQICWHLPDFDRARSMEYVFTKTQAIIILRYSDFQDKKSPWCWHMRRRWRYGRMYGILQVPHGHYSIDNQLCAVSGLSPRDDAEDKMAALPDFNARSHFTALVDEYELLWNINALAGERMHNWGLSISLW